MNIFATRVQAIEVVVPAAAAAPGRLNFQDQPNLRTDNGQTVVIEAMEIFSAEALTTSPLSNVAIAALNNLSLSVLTLQVEGEEREQSIPLLAMNRINTVGATPFVFDLYRFNELVGVDWTKSYIQMVAAPVNPPFSFFFNVYYRKLAPGTRPETYR